MHALAELVRPLATKLQLSTLPLHIQDILAAFLLYELLFEAVSPFLCRYLFPKTYGQLDRRGRVNWDAHVVSMVQCIIINYMALYVMFKDPEREKAAHDWRERLWGYTPLTGWVQGWAAGYFLWDIIVSIQHMDVTGVSAAIHSVAALAVTCLGFRPFANYYGISFVLYELSTPFLNIHWFLDKFGLTGSKAQLVNGILLLASFFGCRLAWGTYQSVLIYHDVWKAWNTETAVSEGCARFFHSTQLHALMDIPFSCRILPTWLGTLYAGANTALSLLNVYWFNKMVSAVRKRFDPAGSGKRESKSKKEL